jgi:hypothetical protein
MTKDDPARRARPAHLAVAAALAAVLTGLWRLVVPLAPPACCDALQYVTLAADPERPVPTPYSYRILVPRLVHLLGGDPATTFHLVSLALLVAAGPVVYALCRRLGAGHRPALVAMAALLSARGWTYYLYSPHMPDPAAFLLLALAFLALLTRHKWLLVPVTLLLAGVRELFVALALPAYALPRRKAIDLRTAALVALLLLPAWLTYRWIVGHAPSTGVPDLGRLSVHTMREIWDLRVLGVNAAGARTATVWWVSLAHTFAMSLGAWWILAAGAWRDRSIRSLAWWLLPVFAHLPFGGDWSRFALYAFPVVIPAGALTLSRVGSGRRRPLLAVLALQALAPLADVATAHLTLNRPGPSLPLTLTLMAATALLLWLPSSLLHLPHRGRLDRRRLHGVEVAARARLDGGHDGALDHGRLGDPGPGPDVVGDQLVDRHRG